MVDIKVSPRQDGLEQVTGAVCQQRPCFHRRSVTSVQESASENMKIWKISRIRTVRDVYELRRDPTPHLTNWL